MTYPANYSLNQQIRRVLYALKRQYGGSDRRLPERCGDYGYEDRRSDPDEDGDPDSAGHRPARDRQPRSEAVDFADLREQADGHGRRLRVGQAAVHHRAPRLPEPRAAQDAIGWPTTAASTPSRTTKSTSSMRRTSSPARKCRASPWAWPGRWSISRPATP